MSASLDTRNLLHRNGSLSESSEEQGMDEDSAASILASVREQEDQFARLTKEIEQERRTVANQLNPEHYGSENDMEYTESMNSDGYYDAPPQDYETFSRSENFSDPHEETEILIDENGVAKTVTKRVVTKTVTERRVRHVEDRGSLPRNNHNGSTPRHPSDRTDPDSYDSIKRTHPGKMHNPQYDDESAQLIGNRSSASSSAASDERGARVGGKPSGYEYPPRKNFGSNDEVRKLAPEKFQPEEYGLENDRRSTDDENDDYR
uniref:Uncharacterized protein n=1 Tax=Ciona savignyi TaxID=51511 RepID=H2ZMU7_CIOSA